MAINPRSALPLSYCACASLTDFRFSQFSVVDLSTYRVHIINRLRQTDMRTLNTAHLGEQNRVTPTHFQRGRGGTTVLKVGDITSRQARRKVIFLHPITPSVLGPPPTASAPRPNYAQN